MLQPNFLKPSTYAFNVIKSVNSMSIPIFWAIFAKYYNTDTLHQ